MNKSDIKDVIINYGDDIFSDVDWNNKSHQTKFGITLKKFIGRILSDIKLIVKDKDVKSTRWEYQFLKEKSTYIPKSLHNTQEVGHLVHLNHLSPSADTTPIRGVTEGGQNVSEVTKVPKSTRELQYWEDPQCKNIKSECTKEGVLEQIKKNGDTNINKLSEKLGNGVFKFKNELISENKIKQEGEILKC